jgi:pyruvate dehydrogenase E2 component (dihydrolipoamide acetyltransferase)
VSDFFIMPLDITIPRLGWSMEEGTFVGWLKKNGETVKAGEPLFTLEGVKASQDIEATDGGLLHIPPHAPQPGAIVKVGDVIGHLLVTEEGNGNQASSPETAIQKPKNEEAPTMPIIIPIESKLQVDGHVKMDGKAASPRARRRAAELGVDTNQLKGSGYTGRIIEADVEKAASVASSNTTVAVSTMRRTIARRTAESFATVPHFYLRSEVDATALLELRKMLLPEIERASGVKLTLTDLVLRAQALALRECPFANVIWKDNQLVAISRRDIGLVVGMPEGLLIPIVRAADEGTLGSLAKQRFVLTETAKAGKLSSEAMEGGATSLSNLGNSRVDEFTAVLPQPHSSILAVGRAAQRPYSKDGWFGARTTLKLCLSVDHRVLDGGPAADYLGRIIELLETPQQLVEGT